MCRDLIYVFSLFQERLELISKQYEADKAKLEKIRLLLVMVLNISIYLKNAQEKRGITRDLRVEHAWGHARDNARNIGTQIFGKNSTYGELLRGP